MSPIPYAHLKEDKVEEEELPPLIPLPKVDIYNYAKDRGMISVHIKEADGRSGPTTGSPGPAPATCII